MTGPAHERARARSRRAAAARAAIGAGLVCLLLAVLPVLRHAPGSPGAVVAGALSIEWWYAGLLGPVAGWMVAIWALKTLRDPRPGSVGRAAPDDAGAASAPSAQGSG